MNRLNLDNRTPTIGVHTPLGEVCHDLHVTDGASVPTGGKRRSETLGQEDVRCVVTQKFRERKVKIENI